MRSFILVSLLTGLVAGAVFSVYAPFLREQGFSGAEYGLLGAAATISSLLASLAGGWLADRYGARILSFAGGIVSSAAYIVFAQGSYTCAMTAAVLYGVGGGVSWVAFEALVARGVSDSKLTEAFSYTSAAFTIGTAAGSFTGWLPVILYEQGFFASRYEAYQWFLLAAGAAGALVAPLYLMLPETLRPQRGEAREGRGETPWRVLAKFAVVEAIIGLGAAMSIHNIDYYFVLKYGVSSRELGSVYGVENLAMALLMMLMPRWSRAVGGPLRAYLFLAAPSIPLIVAMTLVDDFAVAAGLFIVRTVLMNVANPLLGAFQMQVLPREYRGRGAALLGLSWQVPVGLGRAIGGALLDYDVELPLRITAGLYALSFTLLAVFFRQAISGRKG